MNYPDTNDFRSCHPERVKPATNDSVAVLRDVRIQVNKAPAAGWTFSFTWIATLHKTVNANRITDFVCSQ